MSGAVRRGTSLVALLVLVLLSLGYRFLPGLVPLQAAPTAGAPDALPEFHRYDRARVDQLDSHQSPCDTCHPAAAHHRSGERRAFLNLHRRTLDCGVCHLRGRGVSARHFRGTTVVTAETLSEGPYGRVFAAVRMGAGWQPVLAPGAAAALRSKGPECQHCHRRGSPFLATDGLVDPYRRRVLEDLSVQRFFGRKR